MIETTELGTIHFKRKAITAIFPYAAWRARDGQHEMLETFFRVARVSGRWGFMWRRVKLPFVALLGEDTPVSLKRAAVLASPHMPWDNFTNDQHLVQLWAAAASIVPQTNEIGQSVVDALLHIASRDALRPHIPTDMWSRLNERPFPSLVCWQRFRETQRCVVQTVRALGDIETLKSYMLLVWSEWDYLGFLGLHEMCASIQEDFSGIGMGGYREDLLRHLDHVLSQLDLGLEHLQQREPSLEEDDIGQMRYEYGELKNVLLEVDREAAAAMIRELPRLITLSVC
jgi:hypothetical protein